VREDWPCQRAASGKIGRARGWSRGLAEGRSRVHDGGGAEAALGSSRGAVEGSCDGTHVRETSVGVDGFVCGVEKKTNHFFINRWHLWVITLELHA
jgi:hypothetical protein